jgi:hypothetical protein
MREVPLTPKKCFTVCARAAIAPLPTKRSCLAWKRSDVEPKNWWLSGGAAFPAPASVDLSVL